MTTAVKESTPRLEYLFDLALQYRPGSAVVTTAEGRVGKRLGGGDGTIDGPRLQGKVRWDIYERGGVVTGEDRCEINIAGMIETADGASVDFDAKGYGLVPDTSKPSEWSIAAVTQFHTLDERYTWLNSLLAPWHGGLDMQAGRHQYQVFG
jgi:hypothetical protein